MMLNNYRSVGVLVIALLCSVAIQCSSKMETVFTEIYHTNFWKDTESCSGQAASIFHTKVLRSVLPTIFRQYAITSIVDAACGDFNWIKEVDLTGITYVGIDIVKPLIKANQEQYAQDNITFYHGNILTYPLAKVDVIICRDCLVHLTLHDALKTIRNFKKSGTTYLLATTYPERQKNRNAQSGWGWRPLNLMLPPFNFPEPLLVINEEYTGENGITPDKSLGLWRLDEINC